MASSRRTRAAAVAEAKQREDEEIEPLEDEEELDDLEDDEPKIWVRYEDLMMPTRMWAMFGLMIMTIASIANFAMIAAGVPFTSSPIFVTYSAVWLLPTSIGAILGPFLLCYTSALWTQMLTAYAGIAALFAAFEAASALYVAIIGTYTATAVMLNVFTVFVTLINFVGAFMALVCLAILSKQQRKIRQSNRDPRLPPPSRRSQRMTPLGSGRSGSARLAVPRIVDNISL